MVVLAATRGRQCAWGRVDEAHANVAADARYPIPAKEEEVAEAVRSACMERRDVLGDLDERPSLDFRLPSKKEAYAPPEHRDPMACQLRVH